MVPGGSEPAASLLSVFEAELADDAVQVAGQRGQILECINGFLCAVRGLVRQ